MKCSELQSRLEHWQENGWGDGDSQSDIAKGDAVQLPITHEIAAHLSTCAECRQEWETVRTLAEAVFAWREQVPTVDLTAAVLLEYSQEMSHAVPLRSGIRENSDLRTAVRHDIGVLTNSATIIPSPRRPEGREIVRSRGALAIVLAGLAGLFVLSVGPTTRDAGTHRDAGERSPTVVLSSALAPAENGQSLVHNAGSAYLALAQETAGAMRGITALVVPEQSSAGLTLDHVPALSTGLVNELETDFKPLSDSVGGVFNFLWNTATIPDKTAS